MYRIYKLILIAAVVFVLGWVSNEDFKDETRQEEYTCSMIEKGYWPLDVAPYCECGTIQRNWKGATMIF